MHAYYAALLDDLTRRVGLSGSAAATVLARIMSASPQGLPRSDIVRGGPLSAGTVSRATAALVYARLVTEASARAEGPGRPLVPLQLGGDRWATIGVHVHHERGRPTGVTGVLTSLADQVLIEPAHRDLPPGEPVMDAMVRQIVRLVEEGRAAAPDRQLLGLGVEMGAHVHEGRIIEYTNATWSRIEWADTDLAGPLEKATELTVTVDNDINTMAVLELYRHHLPEPHFAVVAVLHEGVGGALVMDRRVYRGAGGMAGEVGHLTVDYAQPARKGRPGRRRLRFTDPCPCGRYGHVDCFATPVRISGELNGANFEAAARSPATDRAGQPTRTAATFGTAGQALGRGLADLINVVNPGRLLLLLPLALAAAEPGTAATAYRQAVEDAVNEAFSTGASDARASADRLTVQPLDYANIHVLGARAAAIRVLDQFLDDLRQHANN